MAFAPSKSLSMDLANRLKAPSRTAILAPRRGVVRPLRRWCQSAHMSAAAMDPEMAARIEHMHMTRRHDNSAPAAAETAIVRTDAGNGLFSGVSVQSVYKGLTRVAMGALVLLAVFLAMPSVAQAKGGRSGGRMGGGRGFASRSTSASTPTRTSTATAATTTATAAPVTAAAGGSTVHHVHHHHSSGFGWSPFGYSPFGMSPFGWGYRPVYVVGYQFSIFKILFMVLATVVLIAAVQAFTGNNRN